MSVESRLKFQSPETSPAKQLSHKQAKWIGTSFKMCKKQLEKIKNTKRILHTAHVAWSKPRSSKIPNWFEKMLFTPFFLEAEIFTLAAKLKALACTPSEVVTQASVSTVRGNNIFFFFKKSTWSLGHAGQAGGTIFMFPKMFCGRWNFTRLSISTELSN